MNGGIPDKIPLVCGEQKWIQELDYEKIPFRCSFCHKARHILWDCLREDIAYKKRRVGSSYSSSMKAMSVSEVLMLRGLFH
jgi:hypothetical protein